MKKMIPVLILISVMAFLGPGCKTVIVGSGKLETRDFDFSGFTHVDIADAFQVEIIPSNAVGGGVSVNINMDNNLFDFLDISQSGDILKIGLRPGSSYSAYSATAWIIMPELFGIYLSGAAKCEAGIWRGQTAEAVEGFISQHDLVIGLSGASYLNVGSIVSGNIKFIISEGSVLNGGIKANGNTELDISGASTVTLYGSANDLNANASGGSHLELENFPVLNANIFLSDASSSTIRLDGTLNANLSGASRLYYIGEPTLNDLKASTGSIISKK